MEKLIEAINNYGSQYFVQWLSDFDDGTETLPANFDWLYLAEKASALAIGENHLNMNFAKSAILIYERIYQDGNNGALLSALYLRLKILEVVPSDDLGQFFDTEVIIETVKNKLSIPVDKVEHMADGWQKLEVKDMKMLREFKNLIKIILQLEKTTKKEYDEFKDWKRIVHLLP